MTIGTIDIVSLGYSYPGSNHPPVFESISFGVATGDIFCLLGPNGSGKSTLLKCLCGILKPDSGSILLNGRDISRLPLKARAEIIGVVPQVLSTAFPFTVREIVVMGRAPVIPLVGSPGKADVRAATQALEKAGIAHLADRPCTQISGGEWQLVLIARALTQKPAILLLDEPTSHLDMGNQMKILQIVDALSNEGLTIIMASHFPDHALLSAGTAAILKNSRMIGPGPPGEILTPETLKQTFGISVEVCYVGGLVNRNVCIPLLSARTETAKLPD